MKRSYAIFAVLALGVGWWWYIQPFQPAAAMTMDGKTPAVVCSPQPPAAPDSTYQSPAPSRACTAATT